MISPIPRAGRVVLGLAAVLAAAIAVAAPLAMRRSRVAARSDLPAHTAARDDRDGGLLLGQIVQDGIRVECRVTPLGRPGPGGRASVGEGPDVRLAFSIVDTAGGTPLAKVDPSAWVVEHPEGTPPISSKETTRIAATLLQGNLFALPELDLNVFYVVTLNREANLTVVDPRFGFGSTKLLALVPLASRGDDWVLGPGGRQIFVAMPEAGQVAVVETQSWTVAANLPGGLRPHRLALHPDGRHLWVAGGAEGKSDSGVTALDTDARRVVARIRTGRGSHDLAISDDGRFVFATNTDEGSVSILDAASFRLLATLPTGRRPTAIAYSARAGLAYVTDATDGTIAAIDPREKRIAGRIAAAPGLGPIRFSPDGRAGFVVNTSSNTVSVLDPATGRLVQSVAVEEGPDQVAFTDEFAYIRHRGSVNVSMIELANAGREGARLPVVTFPAGESPPGASDAPTPAESIIAAPGSGAVLVANPRDRSVYYYKQGLSAPMGTFSNYKREPRAVLVIDRSLRERTSPGVFETTVHVERPGRFDVVFFLDQPRITHAFPMEVAVDPSREAARNLGKVDVVPLVLVPRAEAGRLFRPIYQFNDRTSRAPREGLADVGLLMYRMGGGWQERRQAIEIAAGVYGADFMPDKPGTYHVCVECPSAGLTLSNPHRLTIHVDAPSRHLEPTASGPGSLSR